MLNAILRTTLNDRLDEMMSLKVFCVVDVMLADDDNRILVVPAKHCDVFYNDKKLAEFCNIGIERYCSTAVPVSSKVFYTPCGGSLHLHTNKPDFTVLVKNSFDEKTAALYNGFILKVFGK
jgi:hypothetical protein